MKITTEDFSVLCDKSIADADLQSSMNFLGMGLSARREIAKQNLPEFETLRDEARDIKNHVLENLDAYLTLFETNVRNNGGQVHWAANAEEARQLVAKICRSVDARSVTKSKSMVSEEIDLVPYLEQQGIEAVETDLGEYIIQLRNEKPSHIIAPAIHLNKEQISQTFFEHHSKLGFNEKLTEREDLVGEARQILRRKFLNADVGISGANFLIAETGTIVLVTNEGNAELTIGLPSTHIAITGIEKIVPTLEDASTFIRLLGRSAAGMEISSYTSFITGSKRSDDLDGPENFHIILLDNGRSEMIGTGFQDMLRCIRCSACLNHCPVYLAIGGHAYGSVYNGPMGAVLTPHFANLAQARDLPDASTFCGKCEDVCPVRIPLPALLRLWREEAFNSELGSVGVRRSLKLWAFINRMPWLYRWVIAISARLLPLFGSAETGWIRKLPGIGANWTGQRDMQAPQGRSFMAQWRARK